MVSNEPYILEKNFRAFFDDVKANQAAGKGLIPLIGAGLSAPSGVPIIWELREYLVRCVASALGVDQPDGWNAKKNVPGRVRFDQLRRWNPGIDAWPPVSEPFPYVFENVNWEQRIRDAVDHLDNSSHSPTLLGERHHFELVWR